MTMTDRDIIVIGASRGGLQAICRLLDGLPSTLGAALLLVLHASPKSPQLTDVFSPYTRLKVSYGQQGLPVERGHLYIAPPNHQMTVIPLGYLRLDQELDAAADPLFCSAAALYGRRVIGVMLTGGGDGADGLRKIKAAGGISIVQNPTEALAPDMPMTASKGDDPDFVVSVDEMGPLLARLVRGFGT
jgi:two-component system chemotaxis response regulator CheB